MEDYRDDVSLRKEQGCPKGNEEYAVIHEEGEGNRNSLIARWIPCIKQTGI